MIFGVLILTHTVKPLGATAGQIFTEDFGELCIMPKENIENSCSNSKCIALSL